MQKYNKLYNNSFHFPDTISRLTLKICRQTFWTKSNTPALGAKPNFVGILFCWNLEFCLGSFSANIAILVDSFDIQTDKYFDDMSC